MPALGDMGEEDDATMQEKIPEGGTAGDDTTIHDGRMMNKDSNMGVLFLMIKRRILLLSRRRLQLKVLLMLMLQEKRLNEDNTNINGDEGGK